MRKQTLRQIAVILLSAVFLCACNAKKGTDSGDAYKTDTLQLTFDDSSMRALEQQRTEALKYTIINKEDGTEYPVKLFYNGKLFNASARLKGDWVDHLRTNNWSFRIKLDGEDNIRGMHTFSVQDPKTRDYLNEWFYHQWLMEEDVLATRYDFIYFKWNKNTTALYVIEEHFDKNLVESQRRREGPIMKFTEDALWQWRLDALKNGLPNSAAESKLDVSGTAGIESFKMSAVQKSPQMLALYEHAVSLMAQYRQGAKPFDEIFDIDKMAKYYAIVDICKTYHSLIWHNERYYFNPISQKLEPIGFDGFTDAGAEDFINRPFLGYRQNPRFILNEGGSSDFRFFNNPAFIEKYAAYLYKYTNPTYLDSLFAKFDEPLTQRLLAIQAVKTDYTFNKKFFLQNAATIRLALKPQGDNAVKVFREQTSGTTQRLTVFNQYILPVKILGIGFRVDDISTYIQQPKWLEAYNEYDQISTTEIVLNGEGDYLYYVVPGIDSILKAKINNWNSPAVSTPAQDLFAEARIATNAYMTVSNGEIFFKPGTHNITAPLIIPGGYKVYLNAGTSLNFTKQSFFLSRSPVFMSGNSAQPVIIYSSDSSAQGFTVLQANEPSYLTYVNFSGLNTLNYRGWSLTGAVNFFESDVTFDYCRFVRNHCEDALNTIRCKMALRNSYLAYTFGDAFDSDFCNGKVSDCLIEFTGNDALDVSGSKFEISHCTLKNIGDKGVSVGEQSVADIFDLDVDTAPNGFVAKDKSVAHVNNVRLVNCAKPFVAYMKKTAFGPAQLSVKKYKAENYKQLSDALDGSTITIEPMK